MAQSFVSMVMQYFNPSIIDRMAGAFGESRDSAQKAVFAGVPALLSGFAGFATQPGGADRLASAARQQDIGILHNLPNVIGGSGLESVSDKGRTMLSLMLGGQASEGLIEAVAKHAGLGRESAANMMGLLTPVIMAVLGHHQASQGLDAAGLARFLADQNSAIAGAMPSGLAAFRSDAVEALDLTTPPQRAPTPSWAYALAALVVLALIGYWFWGPHPQMVARQNAEPPAASSNVQAPITPSSVMVVGQVDLAKQLSSIVDSTRASLAGVTDAATARSALPQLQDAVAQLDKVRRMTDQIPADGTKTLTSIVGDAKPALQQSISKVEAMPRVSDVLKPTLDSLQVRLDVFAMGLPQGTQAVGSPQQQRPQKSVAAAPDSRP